MERTHPMLLCEFAETRYLPYVKNCVRENTYVGYESSYRRYVKPKFGNVDMNDITTFDVQTWVDSFSTPGCARRSYATLRQILRKAQDWDVYSGKDPTKCHITLPKTQGNTNKVLTADEVGKLVEGFRGHPLEACVICSVSMGLRRCESFGLKWGDINFDTGSVYVHRSRQCVKGKEVVYPTKTKKSTRTCYLPQFALVRLNEIKRNSNEWILPVPVDKASALYKQHINTNNLPYTPFMNLRHTRATLQIESGTDITVVANMMGHTDITMAYDRYVRPRQSTYEQVQQKFNAAVQANLVSTCNSKSVQSSMPVVFVCVYKVIVTLVRYMFPSFYSNSVDIV